MLQAIREKTSGLIAGIIFFLIILTMAVYAIPSFIGGSFSTAVAEVDGEEISQSEWTERFSRVRMNEQQRFGDAFLPEMVDNPEFKRSALEQLIDEKLMRQDAEQAGIGVSKQRLQRQIAQYDEFKLDGRFNQAQFVQVLAMNRLTPEQWTQQLADIALMNEIRSALAQSMFVADAEIDAHVRMRDQQRNLRFVRLPLADVPAPAEPDEAELKKYYDENPGSFMTPEQLDLEYIEIKLADIPEQAPSEEELLEQFDKVKENFRQPEQRLASHILVEVAADAPADAQKAALEEATSLAAQARAEGAKFDELARKHSDDAGSAEQGGDLGWLQKEATEPAFEQALFALEAGAISDPVKTDQGYHVIQLREVQAEKVKTFDEARAELLAQMTQDRRAGLYSDQIGALTNELLKDPYQLTGPADLLKLEIKRTGLFDRNAPTGFAANPQVQRELASSNVLERGQVSSVMQTGEGERVVFRVAERKTSTAKPFAEVREEVKALVVARNHQRALKEQANAWLARVRKDGKLDAFLEETKKTAETAENVVRTAVNVPAPVLQKAFALKRPAKDQVELALVEISPSEYALVELATVTDGDPTKLDAAARDAVREQLKAERAYAEREAYLAELRKTAEIKIYEERL